MTNPRNSHLTLCPSPLILAWCQEQAKARNITAQTWIVMCLEAMRGAMETDKEDWKRLEWTQQPIGVEMAKGK